MKLSELTAISPLDGRYRKISGELSVYFSEYALIRKRVFVEIEYFIALCDIIAPLKAFPAEGIIRLRNIAENFSEQDALRVKEIEKTTNHDVKAVEYFLREKFEENSWEGFREFIHFGLTSQDINNTAMPLLLKEAHEKSVMPALGNITEALGSLSLQWDNIPMLARTHGQAASPTRLGKEIQVFVVRLLKQTAMLNSIPFEGKFGGATGNLNAHYAAFPETDWHSFASGFLRSLGLVRQHPTTQIEHYDNLAAWFDALKRINTILTDLCRDMWMYISMEYFRQKIKQDEVGSSAMPHKVNPIDFENAEGNLGIANAMLGFLSEKLPVSRLQRDLTDSTVSRNTGVPVAHSLIAYRSLLKGLGKLILNEEKIREDLRQNTAVLAEAIQTILRRENYPDPYNALKALTRTHEPVTAGSLKAFIENLSLPQTVKDELLKLSPENYTGK